MGRSIGARIPPMANAFLSERRMAVAAWVDDESRVWASLLVGPPGFVQAKDGEQLLIQSGLAPTDPLLAGLAVRPELGLVVIDFAERRRFRVNGRARVDGSRILLTVEQAYGNCPKYIEPRRVEPVRDGAAPERPSPDLDARQRSWIAAADTLFIASYHPQGGADASHRGGRPGFVDVLGPRALSFPDYPGNNMFNTLGNIAVQPRVGLLFLDFQSGDTLELTGRASLEWSGETAGSPSGPGRAIVSFDLDLAVLKHAGVVGESRLL